MLTHLRAVPTLVRSFVFVLTALVGGLVAGGVAVADALAVSFVVAMQVVSGSVIWRVAVRETCSVFEQLGMGFVVGVLLTIAGNQLGLAASARHGALLPVVLATLVAWRSPSSAGLVGAPAGSDRATGATVERLLWSAIAVLLGMVIQRPFWQAHPLVWSGWNRPYVDMTYHMALCSVAWNGPTHPLLAGEALRYHWFSHAWMGAVADLGRVEVAVVVLRAVGWCALLAGVALASELAYRLSGGRPRAGAWAALLFVGSASLLPGGLGTTQYLVSPSALLAAPVLLGFLLCVLRAFEGTLVGARLWLAVVTAGLVGSKASHAVMGLVGLAAAVAATAWWEPRLRDRAVGLLVTTTLAFAGTHLALQAGGHTTLTIGWGQALTYTGLPSSPWLAPVSTVAFAVLFLGRDAGVLCALGEPPRAPTARVMVWFALGASACALWLALTLEHAGLGQVYFLQASHVVACPIAGWGVAAAARRMSAGGAVAAPTLLVCVVLMVTARALVGEPGLDRPLALSGVILLVLAACSVVHATAARTCSFRPAVEFASVALATASLLGGVTHVSPPLRGCGPTAPDERGSISDQHVEAARWLARQSSRRCLVASNRLFIAPGQTLSDGDPRWHVVAAYTGRQLFVEGFQYALYASGHASLTEEVRRRAQLSMSMTVPLAPAVLDQLRADGVCYAWIERRQADRARAWPDAHADVPAPFQNHLVTILDLKIDQPHVH